MKDKHVVSTIVSAWLIVALAVGTTALAERHSLPSPSKGGKTVQKFPATGQTTSFKVGDDGNIQAGAPLSYTVNSNGTITDNNTRLMWEKKAMLDGLDNPLNPHDADNIYTWDEAFDFIDRLNSPPCFAKRCDWRLPNIKELQSIINYEKAAPLPAVSEAFNTNCTFPSTDPNGSCMANAYWSSTTRADSPANAWYGNFLGIFTSSVASKSEASISVRAVRGGLLDFLRGMKGTVAAPQKDKLSATQKFPATGQTASYRVGDDGDIQAGAALSYKNNGDGTTTDNNTKLMWENKVLLDGPRNPGDPNNPHDADNRYMWDEAFTFIAQLNSPPCFANHCDWRLPNIKELQSIVNYGNDDPSVSEAFNSPDCASNPNGSCTADFYWSSTTYANNNAYAWDIFGGSVVADLNKDDLHVRAVRGGLDRLPVDRDKDR